ncbi:hypothetical protein M5E87_03145 [Flavonifractor plautii]|nr:hypothetical protein M5E87_03145 [Flavonifractor plautii]
MAAGAERVSAAGLPGLLCLGEPWFVLVMLGSILANYGFGLWVDACKRAGRTCLPLLWPPWR